MKSTKLIILLSFMLCAYTSSFAQSEEMEQIDHEEAIAEIINYNLPFSQMLIQNKEKQNTPGMRNEVHIQQVGRANTIDATIVSSNSNINYTQIGTSNAIQAQMVAEKVQHTIGQKGTGNFARGFSFAASEKNVLNVKQTGENLHFASYGTNSIGNKLQFEMKGNTKTIIVRNYK